MKEKIIEILHGYPHGLRLREIAMYLRCSPYALLNSLDEMKKSGLVEGIGVNNFVQGESYILWKLVE